VQDSRLTAVAIALCLIIGAGIAAETATGPVSEPDLKLEPGMAGITDAVSLPQQINYQGLLTDKDTGEPLEGTVNLTFKLYEDVTQIWTETQTGVGLNNGVFDVLLGSVTPITTIPDAGACSLEVLVDGETMAPKIPLVSVPYAYHADNTCKLQGFPVSSELPSDGKVLTYDGVSTSWRPLALSGGSDAWVRVGSDSVLYTVHQLGIARGGADNVLYGNLARTHINLGVACTTGTSDQNDHYCTVGGGYGNAVKGNYATVAGGYGNTTSDFLATVAGGHGNTASGYRATVGGGQYNDASDNSATVGGGWGNTASGSGATVGGGVENDASASCATVGGGQNDTAKAVYGGVLSGYSNLAGDAAADTGATVCGGYNNTAADTGCFVGGGKDNTASGEYATVSGGYADTASGSYATVGGGVHNAATGQGATVAGGWDNAASLSGATVAGGRYNKATDWYAFVGGGYASTASGEYATVSGGYADTASGEYATVSGGINNTARGGITTVCGGEDNIASFWHATVAGGDDNKATRNASFATNWSSEANHDYSAAFNTQHTTASNQLRCGVLSKTGGSFTIDHPLQPMSTILNHYFVESPEMRNVYEGEVVLDGSGRARVQLPDYFSALNRKPRIQLTGVGTAEVVYVAEKVLNNSFTIGGPAGTEVYWQVTGERKDQSAEAIRLMMPVEQPKTGKLAGHSLDDDFLSGAMKQLEEMGHGSEFNFRTVEGRQQYEESLRPPEQKK